MFSHDVQQITIATCRPVGAGAPTAPAARWPRGRWGRGLSGLLFGALAAWTLGGCFAAPTPHPEDDATLAGGGPNDLRDVSGDAGQGDWGSAAQPQGDADAVIGEDAGPQDQDVMEMGADADGLQDGLEPAVDAGAEVDGPPLDGVEGDVEGDDLGPADAGDADPVGEQEGGEGS